jgi:hypothetical protein
MEAVMLTGTLGGVKRLKRTVKLSGRLVTACGDGDAWNLFLEP